MPESPRPLAGVRVCQLGHFDPGYSRNKLVARALRDAGATVVQASHQGRFPVRARSLWKAALAADPDLVWVGFPGHSDMPLARAAGAVRRVPVVLDAFVSLWDSAVLDRAVTAPGSLEARRYAATDRLACALADRIVLDTDAHIAFFGDRYGVPADRCRRLWVGADEQVMRPGGDPTASPERRFTAFFYGTFIPLHGAEVIVRAAARAPDIRFVLAGDGQTHASTVAEAARLRATNVEFIGRRPYTELPERMAAADLCLGIFGATGKARRVIPNKVFDAAACARPVLTADTPAIRELFTPGAEVAVCPPGDPEALAGALVALRDDPARRAAIAAAGHERYRRAASAPARAAEVAAIVQSLL